MISSNSTYSKHHTAHHQSTSTSCEPGCSFLEQIPPLSDFQMQEIEWDSPPHRSLFQQLVEDPRLSPKSDKSIPTMMQIQEPHYPVSVHGCKCSKIGCLKLYCQCFTRGELCGPHCLCVSCQNCVGNEKKIQFSQQMANFRKPGTFMGVDAFVPQRKCTCKKSKCQKKYCECFNAGLKCTEHCDCVGCENCDPREECSSEDQLGGIGVLRMEIEVEA